MQQERELITISPGAERDIYIPGHGYHCIMAYVIQMEGINEVRPNIATHPAYGKAVEEAIATGVKVLFCVRQ